MTITIHWWMVVIFLVIIPFIYGYFRKSQGQYDMGLDFLAIFISCWSIAIGLTIGKLL